MDQKGFLIILIIFLITSEFYFMIRNIIKYGICLIVIIYIIKLINPDISNNIKNFISKIINSDENIIISTFSYLIKIIKKFFNFEKNKLFDNLFDDELALTKLNDMIFVDSNSGSSDSNSGSSNSNSGSSNSNSGSSNSNSGSSNSNSGSSNY